MKSMTGFGKGTFQTPILLVSAEIRTVNNRFLDINFRLPNELISYESGLRKQIQSVLKRGRADIIITISQTQEMSYEINLPMIKGYIKALRQMQAATNIGGNVDMNLVTRLPGAIKSTFINLETDEQENCLSLALSQALENLDSMRTSEGNELSIEISKHLDELTNKIIELESSAESVTLTYKQKLEQRISNLIGNSIAIDQTRLVQEVAYIAERSDITEEIARLKSHLLQFKQFIEQPGELGKQMDFITQEMNREANTILSKTTDIAIKNLALAIKAEVEKIKEQIQNIE